MSKGKAVWNGWQGMGWDRPARVGLGWQGRPVYISVRARSARYGCSRASFAEILLRGSIASKFCMYVCMYVCMLLYVCEPTQQGRTGHLQQVDARLAEPRSELGDVQRGPEGEVFVPVLQRRHAGPHLLVRGAQNPTHAHSTHGQTHSVDHFRSETVPFPFTDRPEDLEYLVDLRVSGKQRALGHHLRQDRAHGPHVHGQRVGLAAQQDLRGAVPEGHNLQHDTTSGVK